MWVYIIITCCVNCIKAQLKTTLKFTRQFCQTKCYGIATTQGALNKWSEKYTTNEKPPYYGRKWSGKERGREEEVRQRGSYAWLGGWMGRRGERGERGGGTVTRYWRGVVGTHCLYTLSPPAWLKGGESALCPETKIITAAIQSGTSAGSRPVA